MSLESVSLALYQKLVESGVPFEDLVLNARASGSDIEWSKVITTVIVTIGGGLVGGITSSLVSGESDRTDSVTIPMTSSERFREALSDFGVNFGMGFMGGAIFTLGAVVLNAE